jgi:hypothetical protein
VLKVVRFTAPALGIFDVTGFFQDLQRSAATVNVVINGKAVFTDSTAFTGASYLQGQVPFLSTQLLLAAGSTIEFVVDSRQYQGSFTMLGLSATIKASPPFAGTPGQSNCVGQSLAALNVQYGGNIAAAQAFGFSRVQALSTAVKTFCGR